MNKVVLITGGSRGIGRATSEKFSQNGYDIIILYSTDEVSARNTKEELESKYNNIIDIIKCDVSNEEQVKNVINIIKDNYDNIDCIVNNAGIAIDNLPDYKNSDEFLKVLSVNLLGTYLVTKYASKLIDKGSIINVSSTNGIDTNYIESMDYDASKAGVISLTHNFAKMYSPKIRVNAIAPGWVDTEMNQDLDENFKNNEISKCLLKRFATTSEIANIIYFLATDEASYINDAIIRVDGGFNA